MQLATPEIAQKLARHPERTQHIIEEMCQVKLDPVKLDCTGCLKKRYATLAIYFVIQFRTIGGFPHSIY